MAVNFQNLGLAEPSTITARVATVQIARGSTNEQQEILVLGDPESSLGIARVVAAAPDSTHFGLVTRQVGYVAPSTTVELSTGSVRVHQSTAADLQATVGQASTVWAVQLSQYSTTVNVSSVAGVVRIAGNNAADGLVHVGDSTNNALRVNVVAGAAGGSTTVNVSSLAGRVAIAGFNATDGIVNVTDSTNTALRVNVVAGAAGGSTEVTVRQSTAADLQVTASQNSTAWSVLSRLTTSSGGGLEGSTTAPAVDAIGLHVRQVLPTRNSTSVLVNIASAGGTSTLVSSAAGVRHRVYAYAVTSTHVGLSTVTFRSSNSAERWGVTLGSGSSGITGANLAVAPPASLFETDAADPLVFSATSSGDYRVSISWFSEA